MTKQPDLSGIKATIDTAAAGDVDDAADVAARLTLAAQRATTTIPGPAAPAIPAPSASPSVPQVKPATPKRKPATTPLPAIHRDALTTLTRRVTRSQDDLKRLRIHIPTDLHQRLVTFENTILRVHHATVIRRNVVTEAITRLLAQPARIPTALPNEDDLLATWVDLSVDVTRDQLIGLKLVRADLRPTHPETTIRVLVIAALTAYLDDLDTAGVLTPEVPSTSHGTSHG